MNSESFFEERPQFNIADHVPASFSPREEANARRAGYPSAGEKWIADMEYELFKHQREAMERRAKAQARMDQERIGVTPEKLGSAAEDAGNLPGIPRHRIPEEVQVPRDEFVRDAAHRGAVLRAKDLLDRMQRRREEFTDDDWENFFEHEKAEIDRRLEALGGTSFDEIEEALEDGDVGPSEFYEAKPEPRNPELKRIFDEHQGAVDAWQQNRSDESQDDWPDLEEDA